jgi:O-antigen ligase
MKIKVFPAESSDYVRPTSKTVASLNLFLFSGLCLLLAFGPLALGAVHEWAIFTIEAGAALLFVIWALREIASDHVTVTRNPLFIPIVLFAALVIVQLVLHRTAYWYATWVKALLWAAYGLIFFLMSQTVRGTRLWTWLGIFLSVYGALVALFAIAQQFAGNGRIYWIMSNQLGWIYGPYVHHAHYAGLMEMLIPIPLVLAMARFFPRPARILLAFAALVMASSIFLSQSLGGILAFCAQLLLLFFVLAKSGQSRRSLAALGLLCLLLAVSLVALRPVGLAHRLARLRDPLGQADAGSRIAIVKDAWQMGRARPLLGWGLGTFPVVYPTFRSFYSDLWVNEAHNDFVQLWVETGTLGFLLMSVFLATLYRAGFSNIEHWRRDPRAGMALGALIGCAGILVHGLSDFNLQVPANAALFFALAAIATIPRTTVRNQASETTTVKLNYVYGR